MAFKLPLFSLTCLSIVLLFPLLSSSRPDSPCDDTPHPSFCRETISNNNGSGTIHDHARFCVNQSLYKAKAFRSLVKQHMRPSRTRSLSQSTLYALEDCQFLSDLAIDYLSSTSHTINSTDNLTDTDADQVQTMLSAIITGLDTCYGGLQVAQPDSDVIQDLTPHITNNTMLFSVSLALFTNGWAPKSHHGRHLQYTEVKNPNFTFNRKNNPTGYWPSTFNHITRKVNYGHGRKLLQLGDMGIIVNKMVVVNSNGTANFTTITDAVNSAPNNTKANAGYFGIYVVAGTYEEYIVVPSNKKYLLIVGDGINQTVITGNRSVDAGWTTFNSGSFAVTAPGFVAVNITFRNTAGPAMHQAVALRSGADLSAFYKCSFDAYQDTLYTHSMRQFYRECDIYGTVDFIFGNSAVVFQDCNIYPRQPLKGQFNTITAQGRTDPNQNTGISVHNCTIKATNDLVSSNFTVQTYLGRPWKEYSLTVYMQSFMDSLINPAGWSVWSGTFALDTLYYAEYNNTGPGSNTTSRVTWSGYHVINATDASNFTVTNFIVGDFWLPSTGVPYTGGLI